jgi:C4-dicarboxylate-specific signal transduction histidine kinase
LFAGGISHEINSPLQIILSEVEIIEEELKQADAANSEVRESMAVIGQTTRRTAAIARALRNLSRDARQDPLSAVRVSDLFCDADALCRKRMESSGVSLTLVPPEAELFVAGRTAELLHILLNILNNGGDAALLGDPWVRLETRFDDTRVRFQCIDGGPGIPHENRKRLMDPFFTTKAPGRGTGLGLSIANALARRNRGILELVDDHNTTFELRLERVRATGPE